MNSFIQMSDATNQDATCRACDVSTWRGLTQVTTTAVWSVNTANLFNLLSIRQWGVARHIRHSGHLSFCLRSRHLVCSCHWRQFINYRCIRRSIIYQMRTMTDYWSTGWLLSLWFVTVFLDDKGKETYVRDVFLLISGRRVTNDATPSDRLSWDLGHISWATSHAGRVTKTERCSQPRHHQLRSEAIV